MAPETANQKRKRGRPSNASRANESASQTQLTLTANGALAQTTDRGADVDVEEDSRPKKRGRKAKEVAATRPEVPAEVNDRKQAPPKRKRGRPSLSHDSQHVDEAEIEEPNNLASQKPRPRKHGRSATTPQEVPEADEKSSAAVKTSAPKKRGRPSLNRSQTEINDAEPSEPAQVRKRGRPARQAGAAKDRAETADEADDENDGNTSLSKRKARQTRPGGNSASNLIEGDQDGQIQDVSQKKLKKRGRPSLEAKARAGDTQAQKGKKAKPATGTLEAETAIADQPQQMKRRGRPSLTQEEKLARKQKARQARDQEPSQEEEAEHDEEEEPELESDHGSQSPPQHVKRRPGKKTSKQRRQLRNSHEDDGDSRSSSPDPAPYRHLTTRTRQITRQTIQEKWSPLDLTSVDCVTELLRSVSRPVLLRLNNVAKHAQATAGLHAISNRLRSKLTRGFPFPPASTAIKREDELEYERTVDGIQSLEAQLDPLLHSVALLQKEKDRAERALEKEYRLLNQISTNARSEIRSRRDQLKKVHILVPEPDQMELDDLEQKPGEFQIAPETAVKAFSGLEDDEELKNLAAQLGNHMESMRGNLQQIEGVTPAIAKSRAVLKMALLPHLNQDVFQQVLLG